MPIFKVQLIIILVCLSPYIIAHNCSRADINPKETILRYFKT